MKLIENVLQGVNPYVENLQMMKGMKRKDYFLQMQYEAESDEICGVLKNRSIADPGKVSARHVIIYSKTDSQPYFISILNRCYESLQFPLLMPRGDPGWHPDLHLGGRKVPPKVFLFI